jgi:hypothetical protein
MLARFKLLLTTNHETRWVGLHPPIYFYIFLGEAIDIPDIPDYFPLSSNPEEFYEIQEGKVTCQYRMIPKNWFCGESDRSP